VVNFKVDPGTSTLIYFAGGYFFVQNHPIPDDPNRLLDVLKPRDKIKERRYV
jgi:hypothetical protein